jgi:hypothetical protein
LPQTTQCSSHFSSVFFGSFIRVCLWL